MKHNFYLVAYLFTALFLTATQARAQALLKPLTQPQFVNTLPIPSVIDVRNGGTFTLTEVYNGTYFCEIFVNNQRLVKNWNC